MAIYLSDLIAEVDSAVESQVKRVRDQARSILQETLRAECRLVMKTPENSEENRSGAQVPVKILPCHPAILKELAFPEDLKAIRAWLSVRAKMQPEKDAFFISERRTKRCTIRTPNKAFKT